MLGQPMEYDAMWPEDTEVLWPAYVEASPEILEWLRAEGVEPGAINKHSFEICRTPDGQVFISFQEFIRTPEGHLKLHTCPEPGCGDSHYAKSSLLRRDMKTPPPLSPVRSNP